MIRHFIACLLALFALNAWAAVEANQASRAELETVKGIGPGLSGKIVDARQSAAFKDWADLVDRVGGIGPGNAARFSQAGLTVAGAGYTGGAGTAPAKAPKAEKAAKPAKADKAEPAAKATTKAKAAAAAPQ